MSCDVWVSLRIADKTTIAPFIRYFAQQSYEVILEIEYFAPIHSFMPSNVNKGGNQCKGLLLD